MTETTRRTAYLLGCQRSGTTLLRLLLAAHHDVVSVDEEAAYPVLAGRRSLQEMLPGDHQGQLFTYKIPRFSEQLLEAEVSDEIYGQLLQFYRREPCVFILRDPRDVVASMCSLRAGADASWIQAYGRDMVEHRVLRRPGYAEEHADRIAELRRREWPPHLTAAMYWLTKNAALSAYVDAGLPVLPLRYESLVADAASSLQSVCRHFSLPFDEQMLRHQEVEHDQLQDSGLAIGDSNPHRAIDSQSVGRYHTILDADALHEVERWTRESFGHMQSLLPAN